MSMPAYGRDVAENQMYRRHRFDKEIIRDVNKCLASNNYMGLFQVAEDWLVVLASVMATLFVYNNVSGIFHVITAFVYVLALLIIGGRHRSLADLLHQASHGCLAANKQLNHILGTFGSGYLIFQSYSVYVESHVRLHHTYLGNRHKDPDYIGLIENLLCGKHRSSKNTWDYIKHLISVGNSVNYIKYVVFNRIYNKTEDKQETMIRVVYWCLIFCALHHCGWVRYFVLFWMLPFVTSNVWIGSLLELLEHFPMIDDNKIEYKDVYLTHNRVFNWFVDFFIGVHWEGYHLVHHLFPKIPSWHYKKVHHLLMKDKIYANLNHNNQGVIQMINGIIQRSDH